MRFGISTIDGTVPKSVRLRRPHWITPAIYIVSRERPWGPPSKAASHVRSGLAPLPAPVVTGARLLGGESLDLHLRALFLELLPDVLGFCLRDLLLDGLRCTVDEVLGFLEAETGQLTNDLDDLDLLFSSRREDHVELRLLFGGGS